MSVMIVIKGFPTRAGERDSVMSRYLNRCALKFADDKTLSKDRGSLKHIEV